MFTFKDYLHQQKASILSESAKNMHLEHVEDNILNHGLVGAKNSLAFIKGVAGMLRGHTGKKKLNITTKWDGSPAILVGINPENGKFFVGTKAVFGKANPKIIYTKADVKKYYGDVPGLAKQLLSALEHLPKLGIKGVLQGDMMFSEDEIDEKTLGGEEVVTFKPNTILYAVPANSDLAKKIKRAKMGIIFHTKYEGDTMKDMSSSFNVSVEGLKRTPDVWFDDATYTDDSGAATFTIKEDREIEKYIALAEKALANINSGQLDQLLSNKTLISMLKMHTNAQIRGGQQFHGNFLNEFGEFVSERIDKEKTKDESKVAKKEKYATVIQQFQSVLVQVLSFQSHINDAKLFLINKLKDLDSIGTFLPDGEGFKVTSPEGFVAVDHIGSAVKLVDRLEFSRANLTRVH